MVKCRIVVECKKSYLKCYVSYYKKEVWLAYSNFSFKSYRSFERFKERLLNKGWSMSQMRFIPNCFEFLKMVAHELMPLDIN